METHDKEVIVISIARVYMPGMKRIDLEHFKKFCKILEDTLGSIVVRPKVDADHIMHHTMG